MSGLWFEQFEEGQVFNHPLTRTVTEADNMWFSNATMNPQPLHIDFHMAAQTEFGKPLVNSIFTLGLMIGIELDRPCAELVKNALNEGLLINVTAERVIRLLPPLITTDKQADMIIEQLSSLITDFLAEQHSE